MVRIDKICKTCGSDAVAVDAWAVWDADWQKWVCGDTYEESHCFLCDGPTTICDKEIEDPDEEEIESNKPKLQG